MIVDTERSSLEDYNEWFKRGKAFAFYSGGSPLENLVEKTYGDSCFTVRKANYPSDAKIVTLCHTSEEFEQYLSLMYKRDILGRHKVLAYGSVKVLMLDFDEKDRFGEYRDAIGVLFADGCPFAKYDEEIINGWIDGGKFQVEKFLESKLKND